LGLEALGEAAEKMEKLANKSVVLEVVTKTGVGQSTVWLLNTLLEDLKDNHKV
jgi:hypothetical protein